jgi:hypothetical protein
LGEEDELESRTTPIQEGEDDEDISPFHTIQGLITRARAQRLYLQVRSNLVNYFLELTLGSMHGLLIRNNGEDQQGLGEGQGVKKEELGCPHQGGVHVQLDFDYTSDSEPNFTKIDAMATYGVGFGCYIYGWNHNFIEPPIALAPPQNSF